MPGQKTGMFVDSGGNRAMSFIANSVTTPVAPTTTLYVRRRDSHQRRMPVVLRASAGAGNRRRVRADTVGSAMSRPVQSIAAAACHQVLCHAELGAPLWNPDAIAWYRPRTSSPTADPPRRMANYITLSRTLLSFVVVAMLHVRTKWMYVGAFA